MKKYIAILFSLIVSCIDSGDNTNKQSIQIQSFENLESTKPSIVKEISDNEKINQILGLVDMLPDSGEIFIKFGTDTKLTKIMLDQFESKFDTILIYGDRIQSINTTFYEPKRDQESEILELIE